MRRRPDCGGGDLELPLAALAHTEAARVQGLVPQAGQVTGRLHIHCTYTASTLVLAL
jgi:hypothetical protein